MTTPSIGPALSSSAAPSPQEIDHFRYVLTEEAQSYLSTGSPEAQVFNAVPAGGLPMAELKVRSPQRAGRAHAHATHARERAMRIA